MLSGPDKKPADEKIHRSDRAGKESLRQLTTYLTPRSNDR
jgi:hypothetical protein